MNPVESTDLRSELMTLRNEVAALRAARQPRGGCRGAGPRRLFAAFSAFLLMALVPLSILAANPFNDLTGGVHDPNIEAIYSAGITTGCVPNESYCPTDLVTRQEMASFLARTAGLGNNPAVANAKTAQTATNATNAQNAVKAQTADLATTAQTAQKANTLGGLLPTGFVRAARSTTDVSSTVGSTEASYLTVDLVAPGKGQVLVTATVDLVTNGTACPCEVNGRLWNVQGVAGNTYSNIMNVSLINQDDYHATLTLTYLFTVEEGNNSFRVLLDRTGGDVTTVKRDGAQMTALFITNGTVNP